MQFPLCQMEADMQLHAPHRLTECVPRALGALALFAAALAMTPARAAEPSAAPTAATTSVPISVADGCSYKTMNAGFGFGNSNVTVFGHGYNFFTVKFTNETSVVANQIVFQIDFGKASRIVIPDVGTFAPGATIQTTFRDNGKSMVYSARPTPNDGSVICTVLSAAFADGSSYAAPTAAPTPQS